MTIEEFQILPKETKYNIAFNEGTFLHSITYSEERTVLYSLHLFFIEIVYDLRDNKIMGLKAFEEGFLLGRYARSISADLNNDQSFDKR